MHRCQNDGTIPSSLVGEEVENQRWQRRMRKEEVSGEEAELEKVMVAVVIWTKAEEAGRKKSKVNKNKGRVPHDSVMAHLAPHEPWAEH